MALFFDLEGCARHFVAEEGSGPRPGRALKLPGTLTSAVIKPACKPRGAYRMLSKNRPAEPAGRVRVRVTALYIVVDTVPYAV